MPVPKTNPARNAILQHATKYEGDEPYTPAPPRTSQTGIMHVFRRLSSNGNLAPASKRNAHGLVERRVLNVDQHRERCDISGLHQAKLRRVAFCVDVEIAPMPKYSDSEVKSKKITPSHDKTTKRKITEKGEGEALKSSRTAECQTAEAGEKKKLDGKTDLKWSKEEENKAGQNGTGRSAGTEHSVVTADKTGSEAKKKEKKKKSEEERKARKEKKRKQAEANGTIPMEIHPDSDSSTDVVLSSPVPGTAKAPAQFVPTTNPARIYRRCCQLRETPILKKITEQLTNATNCSTRPGMVDRLDLTGYWMQLSDLIALGDYLAVVPVKELIMENCGLTDEGLRVILAGLLAAREPEARRRKAADKGLTQQGGAVERLVLRNNKIGPEGWKHICLFVYLCRTLQCLDLSKVQFPQETAADPNVSVNGIHGNGSRMPLDTCGLFVKALKERLGGSTLGLLNMSETGLSTSQLGLLMDAVIKSGIRKLGLAHNNIDPKGIEYVVRFLGYDGCDGLDLGGNDLRDQLGVIADAIPEGHRIQGLSLAECNLVPWSLCKLLPKLVKLGTFKFLDLSHNPELFTSQPSAVPVLRRQAFPGSRLLFFDATC